MTLYSAGAVADINHLKKGSEGIFLMNLGEKSGKLVKNYDCYRLSLKLNFQNH